MSMKLDIRENFLIPLMALPLLVYVWMVQVLTKKSAMALLFGTTVKKVRTSFVDSISTERSD